MRKKFGIERKKGSAIKTDKLLNAKDILDYFKNWDLDQVSSEYLKFHCYRYEFLLKEVFKIIGKIQASSPDKKIKILDIGKSFQTEILRSILPETVVNTLGFEDFRFKSRDQEKFIYFDLNDAQYPEIWPKTEEHDLIIMAEIIEHLYTSPLNVLKCIAGYLKSGGHLIIQTPNACSLNKRLQMLIGKNPFEQIRVSNINPGHFREYTIEELIDIAKQSGFVPVKYSICNYFNDPSRNKLFTINIIPDKFKAGITASFKKIERPELLTPLHDNTIFSSGTKKHWYDLEKEPLTPLHDNRIFSHGWYDIEKADSKYFRWGSGNCLIQLTNLSKALQLRIFSSFPNISKKHVTVFFTNEKTREIIQKVVLINNMEQSTIIGTRDLDKINLGIFVDTTWKPAQFNPESDDQRELGIGITDLKFI